MKKFDFKQRLSEPYIIFYATKFDAYNAYRSDSKTIEIISYKTYMTYSKRYEMLKSFGCEATTKGLKAYVPLFIQYVDELQKVPKTPFYWLLYKTNNHAVAGAFKKYAGKFSHHESISKIEYEWSEKTFGSGIRTLDEKYADKLVYGYGYDLKMCHPHAMASKNLLIPNKQGHEFFIDALDFAKYNDWKEGYYHVNIKCTNPEFRKLFSFSKHNVYTKVSLYQAFKYQKQFTITIELVHNKHPNAYLYEKEDMETGHTIFGNWFKTHSAMRDILPENKLLKHLLSSASGQLHKKTVLLKTEKEIKDECLDFGSCHENHDYTFLNEKQYKTSGVDEDGYDNTITKILLLNNKSPINKIRFRPFLMSFIRNTVSRISIIDLSHVIRICEDAVIFSQEQDLNKIQSVYHLIPEDKSTGILMFNKNNRYNHKIIDFHDCEDESMKKAMLNHAKFNSLLL